MNNSEKPRRYRFISDLFAMKPYFDENQGKIHLGCLSWIVKELKLEIFGTYLIQKGKIRMNLEVPFMKFGLKNSNVGFSIANFRI